MDCHFLAIKVGHYSLIDRLLTSQHNHHQATEPRTLHNRATQDYFSARENLDEETEEHFIYPRILWITLLIVGGKNRGSRVDRDPLTDWLLFNQHTEAHSNSNRYNLTLSSLASTRQ